MKVLVIGASGQLGFDIIHELKLNNIDCIGCDSKVLDITNKDSVDSFIRDVMPTHIINCAGYTKVDLAEDNIDLCRKINVIGTKNIVSNCINYNIPIVHFSTDYVFDGTKKTPYEVDDEKNPLSVYGKSKYDSELEVEKFDKFFIIRISWVFGVNGNNFVNTMVNLSKTRDVVSVVKDQIGSPTYSCDVSKLVIDMIKTDNYGVYHATNEGFVSFADFAREIFKLTNKNTRVENILTKDFNSKAKRPLNSMLNKTSLVNNGFRLLPNWEDALSRYIKEKNIV